MPNVPDNARPIKLYIFTLSILRAWPAVASGRGSRWMGVVVPRKIGMVAQFSNHGQHDYGWKWCGSAKDLPRSDQVCNCEDNAQHNTSSSNHHVGDSQERVLSTHHASRGDEDVLGATVNGHGED
jgi:hypothetical protein